MRATLTCDDHSMVSSDEGEGESDVDAVPHAALQRLALLAEATDALSSTPDGTAALRRLWQVLLPQLTHWCATDLLDNHGHPHRGVVAHRDRLPTAHLKGPLPPVPEDSPDPLVRVLRDAGPLLVDPSTMASATDSNALHAAQLASF